MELTQDSPLPSAPFVQLAPNVKLQRPLSRQGHGPGLIILKAPDAALTENKRLDPEPIQKWAEEGFAVIEVTVSGDDDRTSNWHVSKCVASAITTLQSLTECTEKEKFGVIGKIHKSNLKPLTAEINYSSIQNPERWTF